MRNVYTSYSFSGDVPKIGFAKVSGAMHESVPSMCTAAFGLFVVMLFV